MDEQIEQGGRSPDRFELLGRSVGWPRPCCPRRAFQSSAVSGLLFIERDASHADDREAEISNPVENPVQRRLIWKGAGKNGRVAQDLDAEAFEPIRPPLVQDALHPDLVASWPKGVAHDGGVPRVKGVRSRRIRSPPSRGRTRTVASCLASSGDMPSTVAPGSPRRVTRRCSAGVEFTGSKGHAGRTAGNGRPARRLGASLDDGNVPGS